VEFSPFYGGGPWGVATWVVPGGDMGHRGGILFAGGVGLGGKRGKRTNRTPHAPSRSGGRARIRKRTENAALTNGAKSGGGFR